MQTKEGKKVTFKLGDWVWCISEKNGSHHKENLSLWQERITLFNNNAYKLDLSGGYGVSNTFNVLYLCSFHVGDD